MSPGVGSNPGRSLTWARPGWSPGDLAQVAQVNPGPKSQTQACGTTWWQRPKFIHFAKFILINLIFLATGFQFPLMVCGKQIHWASNFTFYLPKHFCFENYYFSFVEPNSSLSSRTCNAIAQFVTSFSEWCLASNIIKNETLKFHFQFVYVILSTSTIVCHGHRCYVRSLHQKI